jgi:hypothetical protein
LKDDVNRTLEKKILSLPSVERRKSRFNHETAYFIRGREFAHFHSSNEIDIRLTKKRQQRLREQSSCDPRLKFRPHPSDWVSVICRLRKDVHFAFDLAQIGQRTNFATDDPDAGPNCSSKVLYL